VQHAIDLTPALVRRKEVPCRLAWQDLGDHCSVSRSIDRPEDQGWTRFSASRP
jgi:hypothetical protein